MKSWWDTKIPSTNVDTSSWVLCSGRRAVHFMSHVFWFIPPLLCVCFYKQNVEVTRMSEEALLTVPAHQWGSTPTPPTFSLPHTQCTLQTHNDSVASHFSSSPSLIWTFFFSFFLPSTFRNMLLIDWNPVSIFFFYFNPMTLILCQACSPIFGEWSWGFI